MNKFIQAVKDLDIDAIEASINKDPKWLTWQESDGKNALHFLCRVKADDPRKQETSLQILKLLVKNGMDINAIQKITGEDCGIFPATPLWHAYAIGRNEKLYHYLLDEGACPENCMFAIAWNDDVTAVELFRQHGAKINSDAFLAAFTWRRFKVAEWMLEHGADVNVADDNSNTALYYAVKRKYPNEQITLLLKYGADINKENKDRVSAKGLAEVNGQRRVLNLFKASNL